MIIRLLDSIAKNRSRLLLCLGYSLYWAWNMLERSGLLGFHTQTVLVNSVTLTFFAAGASALFLLLIPVMKFRWFWSIYRVLMFLAAVAICAQVLLIAADIRFEGVPSFYDLVTVTIALSRTLFNISCGIWILSLPRRHMLESFMLVIVFSAAFWLAAITLPRNITLFIFVVYCFLSGILIVSLKIQPIVHVQKTVLKPAVDYLFGRFIFVRLFIGFIIGMSGLFGLGQSYDSLNDVQQQIAAGASAFLLLVGMALMFLTISGYNQGKKYYFLAPLGVSFFLIAPIALNFNTLSYVSYVLVWFSTSILANAHLMQGKGLRGMDNTKLGVVGMTVCPIAGVLGSYFFSWLAKQFGGFIDIPQTKIYLLMIVFYVVLIFATYFMGKLSPLRERAVVREDTLAVVLDQIAEEFGLSVREKEVFALLVQGYSRIYISEAMVISLSTVKFHVNNVYNKIGINKHDEVLDFYKDYI